MRFEIHHPPSAVHRSKQRRGKSVLSPTGVPLKTCAWPSTVVIWVRDPALSRDNRFAVAPLSRRRRAYRVRERTYGPARHVCVRAVGATGCIRTRTHRTHAHARTTPPPYSRLLRGFSLCVPPASFATAAVVVVVAVAVQVCAIFFRSYRAARLGFTRSLVFHPPFSPAPSRFSPLPLVFSPTDTRFGKTVSGRDTTHNRPSLARNRVVRPVDCFVSLYRNILLL